ncbi:MAG: nitroreductase family protein [Muribaculaceae bacterium]|nr:nitroreductase family protein [Muribaculaceae bacterium]
MNYDIQRIAEANPAYGNIIGRTSVRRYTDQPVDTTLVEALCVAAMSAPSGVNKQPWELIVVDDRRLLAELAAELPYAKMTAQAPLAIVVCGNRERFLDGDDASLWEQDLSAASENILLAAHAVGLGAVWTCLYPHADRIEAVRRTLDIPDSVVPFNLIPVGHPAAAHEPMDKWHPERVHRNGF